MTRLIVADYPIQYEFAAKNVYRKAGLNIDAIQKVSVAGAMALDLSSFTRIDALGSAALYALTGKKGLETWRGSPLPLIGEDKPRVIATLCPSDIMAQQLMIPTVVSDLKKSLICPPEFYNLDASPADLDEFVGKSVCFDIETDYPVSDRITMIGFSYKPFHVTVVPFTDPYLGGIRRIIESAPSLVGQNILQFDLPRLKREGIEPSSECDLRDLMLEQHLIQPDCPHDLSFIQSIFCNKPFHKDKGYTHTHIGCARDVDVTLQCHLQVAPLLKHYGLEDLYRYTQVPLAKICYLMTETGIQTDPARVTSVRERVLGEMKTWEGKLPEELKPYEEKRFHKRTGKPLKSKLVIPWKSDKLKKEYLYTTLGLPVRYKAAIKKGVKVKCVTADKKALTSLFRLTNNEALNALREINKCSALLSGFLKLKKLTAGAMHPNFNPHGTNSGRLSSSKPNFQNQPPAARYIYVAHRPSWQLIEADYSQGENRLVAYYSGDQERLARLKDPAYSEHKQNAAVFFGIPYEQVKKDNDRTAPYGMAKILTHGMGYGKGPISIAQDNELDLKFVKGLVENWKAANPLTVQWQKATTRQAEREGALTTPFGRKRWFWSDRTYTESLAFLPQSSLGDICFRAMISLYHERINWPAWKALKVCSVLAPLPEPAVLHMQGHDALLFSSPSEIMHNALCAIKSAMEMPHAELENYRIPVEIKEGKVGQAWGELE